MNNLRDIPATLCIEGYMHCSICIQEKPDHVSPADYQRLSVGWTEVGLQVWCRRHNVNVAHIDLLGQKINMNTAIATVDDMH